MTRKFTVARGEDFGVAYDFPTGTAFTGYTAVMNVYSDLGGTTLLSFGTTASANGSAIQYLDNIVGVTIKVEDIDGLPVSSDPTGVNVLYFDIFLTSPEGSVSKLDGGAFVLQPVGSSSKSNLSTINVALEGEKYTIVVGIQPGAVTSAANAYASEVAAAASQVAAAASATDAANSASSSQTYATDSYNSSVAAATSATNSANSATAAAGSATNAASSASAASGSASNAATSATNAASSASSALSSKNAAATSETNAAASATSASTSASTASTAATNAASSQTSAAASATTASNAATSATGSASSASTSASNASTSATNAANSANDAAADATVALGHANDAATSATAAATSATNSANSATAAAGSATSASTYASNSATSATNAANSASSASTSSGNAAIYASAASGSATSAASSASAASTSATNAANSATSAATSASNAASAVDTALASTKSVSGAWTFSTAPVVPTQAQGNNSTKAASTAYVDTGLSGKANLSGATFTGTIFSPAFVLNGSAGSYRELFFQTSGSTKWVLAADASDNLDIISFDDSGNSLGNAIAIDRLSQIAYFNVSPIVPNPSNGDNSSKAATTAFVNNNAVSYINAQTLTTAQQNKARTNIGAILTPSIQPPSSGDSVSLYEAGAALAGSTNTLVLSAGNYVFASTPTGDADVTVVGFGAKQPGPSYTAGSCDASALNVAGVSVTQLMTLSANQNNIFVGAYINNTGGAAPAYQKSGILSHIKQSDPSATGYDRDAVGIEGVAEIVSGNTYGRIFPLHAQGIINSGGDGYCVLLEVGLVNNGSAQPLINQQTSKIGLSVVADGTYDGTAGLLFVGVGSKWETGIYGQASALNTNFIRLDDLFCVTAGGFIGVGTTSPGTAALYRKTVSGDAKVILETSDSMAGSFVDFIYTGVVAGSFGLNLSSRNMVVAMDEGVNSSIHTQFVRGGGIIIPKLSSDPSSPSEGEMWENTTSHVFKIYLNGAVKTVNAI